MSSCRATSRFPLLPLILAALLLSTCAGRSGGSSPAPYPAGPSPATVPAPAGMAYYVAPGGDDENPGTLDHPWRTVQHAADTLVAGETVYIRAGVYAERVVPGRSGAADAWITYAAFPGETATIDGDGIVLPDDLDGLFHIADRSYIRVTGLRVINAGPHADNAGVLVDRSSNIVLENNRTYNTFSSGIGVWNSDHVVVAGNRIESACGGGWQECLTVAGTDLFEVRNNEVLDCHKEGICIKDGASNGDVCRNRVHGADRVGLYVDAWDKHTHDIDVYQNVIHDNGGDGLALASEMGGTLEAVRVFNNLAYHNRWVGFSVTTNGAAGPMDGVTIVNNTAYDNGWADWGGGVLVDNPNVANVVVRNNIASQNLYFQLSLGPAVPLQNLALDHNLIDGYRGTEGEITGDDYQEGDPLFRDPAAADFHLEFGSPAIDTGSPVAAPAADLDGRPRPWDGDGDGAADYDIGAYEAGAQMAHQCYLPLAL